MFPLPRLQHSFCLARTPARWLLETEPPTVNGLGAVMQAHLTAQCQLVLRFTLRKQA